MMNYNVGPGAEHRVRNMRRKTDMKAALVIMAAGLGSRYGGNKQVDGVGPGGEILMEYSIHDAIRAGFTKIVFIIKTICRT